MRRTSSTVTVRPFDNWSTHQNWALANLPFRHPWVLYIDADERVTPELAGAAQRAVADAGATVSFRIRRRDFFMGTWLRRVQATAWYQRLFLHRRMRYERLVHPISIADGPVADLTGGSRAGVRSAARHVAMYVLKSASSRTYSEIGRALGVKSHASVAHACEQVARRRAATPALDAFIDDLVLRTRRS